MPSIIVVRPGEPPVIERFPELTLKIMQDLVGGYIQMVPIGEGITMMVNEDGISLGLKPNRWDVLGTVLFCRGDDGLRDGEIDHWLNRLSA